MGWSLTTKRIRVKLFFERKNIIEELEANLTGSPIDNSNTDDSEVSEEANYDEAVNTVAKDSNDMGIDLEEEHKTEENQETIDIDIKNIDKIEKRYRNYAKKEENTQSYTTRVL